MKLVNRNDLHRQEWSRQENETFEGAGEDLAETLVDALTHYDGLPYLSYRDMETGQWYVASVSVTLTRAELDFEKEWEEEYQEEANT